MLKTKATIIATRMTRIKRIYADFLSPAAKVFWPQRHEDTKPDESKVLTLWLCAFVPILVQSRRRRDKNPRKSA